MDFQISEFLPALPEIFMLCMACVILVVDLFVTDRTRGATYILAQVTLVAVLLITVASWSASEAVLAFGWNRHGRTH